MTSDQTMRCLKCFSSMEEVLTRKGVLIDVCSSCKGVWLDQGELNFFAKNKKILNQYELKGLESACGTGHRCPRCRSRMRVGRIPGFPHQVEECLNCRGLFFDAHEFKKFQTAGEFKTLRRDYSVSLRKTSGPSLTSSSSPTSSQSLSSSPSQRSSPSSISSPSPSPSSSSSPNQSSISISRSSSRSSSSSSSSPNQRSQRPRPRQAPPFFKMPSLALQAGLVCFGLYGFLFALVVFLMETMKLSPLTGSGFLLAFIALQFYFSPILIDWQLRLCGSLDWVPPDRLPSAFKNSLLRLCAQSRIPVPKVGIIRDGSPQAYTYGRTPYSARVVFSKGMFDLLDEEELEAVLAHELGHIKHWDFVVMTVIKVVPLLLYIIYRKVKEELSRGGDSKNKAPLGAALVVSYMAYLISEYLVLFVSRVREYHADKFSCFATKKPNKLLTALVKISYGLLASRPASSEEEESHEDKVKGVEALGIMSVSRSKQLALASQGKEDHFSPEVIQDIMRWDLWSPWAFYYELNSTHPLTAKRINAIGSHAFSLKQQPFLVFQKEKPESYWDDFFGDLLVLFLPYILGVAGLLLCFSVTGLGYGDLSALGKDNILLILKFGGVFVFCLSFGGLIRLLRSYPPGRFSLYSVSSLLKLIKVSPVRSYPVTLKGRILGRGDAGNIFSEDLVLQDQTGLLYLNHEPFGLNILFALFRYKQFHGKEVRVTGWYRRSPSPYLEVKDIISADKKSRAYTFYYKAAFCLFGLIAGFALFFL